MKKEFMQLIEKMKSQIQFIIKTSREPIAPEQVLILLLQQYSKASTNIQNKYSQSSSPSNPPDHILFCGHLIKALPNSNTPLLELLNDYLEKHSLKQEGNFLAILIAFFSYYEDCYYDKNTLNQYPRFKKEIALPTWIYKQGNYNENINWLLEQLKTNDIGTIAVTGMTLKKLSLSEQQLSDYVTTLLAYAKNQDTSIQGTSISTVPA